MIHGEERKTPEPTLRSRIGSKDRIREIKAQKGIDVTGLKKILKGMENLKIAMVKKSEECRSSSRYVDRYCIWCSSSKHDQKDRYDYKEALKKDLIYFEGNPFHKFPETIVTKILERRHQESV